MKFMGRTYLKPTAWDGKLKLGVVALSHDRYAVYWLSLYGKYTPFRTDILPEMGSHHEMQMVLDIWATDQKLEAA